MPSLKSANWPLTDLPGLVQTDLDRLSEFDITTTFGLLRQAATKPGQTHMGLEEAHRDLKISPAEFDEVAAELGRSLDHAKVPAREKGEVLAAFAAHKKEVTTGYKSK